MAKKSFDSDDSTDENFDRETQLNDVGDQLANHYPSDVVGKAAQIIDRLKGADQKNFKPATELLQDLPKEVLGLLDDADDAYYAAEYDRAIQLYRQILMLVPGYTRAKDFLAKAETEKAAEKSVTNLPRSAIQFYRRALPFIAEREFVTAEYLLRAAIDAARTEEREFPDAQEALTNLVNSLTAITYRRNANNAIINKRWRDALEFLKAARALDPALNDADDRMIREIRFKLAPLSFLKRILNRLAGDTTTDAPPPVTKKKKKK